MSHVASRRIRMQLPGTFKDTRWDSPCSHAQDSHKPKKRTPYRDDAWQHYGEGHLYQKKDHEDHGKWPDDMDHGSLSHRVLCTVLLCCLAALSSCVHCLVAWVLVRCCDWLCVVCSCPRVLVQLLFGKIWGVIEAVIVDNYWSWSQENGEILRDFES